MQLNNLYKPIKKDLFEMEQLLRMSILSSKNKSILNVGSYLLDRPGKRLRPALVILCAKATSRRSSQTIKRQVTKIASGIELIHIASLIHDDVIDHASLRHSRPSVNYQWGQDVSVALGDYLYSKASELISSCGNMDVLSCISQATALMCEGELIQVCERDNLDLLRERYLIIVKNKTASLFAASCQSGALLSNCQRPTQIAFKQFGFNFGIAFQIADDCLDLISRTKDLGKSPGADFRMGEVTLPILNLLSQSKDKLRIISLVRGKGTERAFGELRQMFLDSDALLKTKRDILFFIEAAKGSLRSLKNSCFKESLISLAEHIIHNLPERGSYA